MLLVALGALTTAPAASADFPYTGPSGNPRDPTTWKLPPGVAPTNYGDDWKLAATPEQSSQSDLTVNPKADELCGIRGMSVVDSNAVFPAGTSSCVPPASPVRTSSSAVDKSPSIDALPEHLRSSWKVSPEVFDELEYACSSVTPERLRVLVLPSQLSDEQRMTDDVLHRLRETPQVLPGGTKPE